MSPPPASPRIYHITHVDNLPAILARGGLLSDAAMNARGGPTTAIGMSSIKQRRLTRPVRCHAGDCVGDYVPFYFCPRSIMLFVIHCANHPDLAYRGGQRPIVHMEAELYPVVAWATSRGRRWAFSLSNAGAGYAEFRNDLADLTALDWNAIAATDFRDARVKEAKQAEFLVHGELPWTLVREIGVHSRSVATKVLAALARVAHRPVVNVRPNWYF